MLVKVFGAAVQGIHATLITIEVNCTKGIKFLLVGLPDASVKESHERIVSALQVNGFAFPRQQIIVNMSPADIRKEGSGNVGATNACILLIARIAAVPVNNQVMPAQYNR